MATLEPAVVVAIATGLAMDAFAVSIACSVSMRRVTPRQLFRLAFHFGWFQAMMPVIGWLLGSVAQSWIHPWDGWIAFSLLCLVGGKAVYQSLTNRDADAPRTDPTKGWTLVGYSVATSIDALAVGMSLAMLDVRIWGPAVAIGIITAFLTAMGMMLGSKLGHVFGNKVEIAGGLVLIGIGVKVLADHILA